MSARRQVHTVAVIPANPRWTAEAVDFRTHVSVAQAATTLGLSQERVYRLIRLGQIQAVRTPQGILCHVDSIGREHWRRELAAREAATKQAAQETTRGEH